MVIMLVLFFCFSLQAYGQETMLNGQGNLSGMIENIRNMKADFLYLEQEIMYLEGECRG